MKNHRVFITGGAGFIGRWVVERCLREGSQVAVYDNLCAGRADNLSEFADRITFYEADVLDGDALAEAMGEASPDMVFHLAAHHFIPFCNAHPAETLRVNVEGTYNVLARAASCGVQTAVVASSGVLYPSRDEPLREDIALLPPDVYGLSKLQTEQVAEYVARTSSLRCVVARLFNTYGPYETNPHLIPHIMESLHAGPVISLGNVQTKRDYIYVEDVANLLLSLGRSVRGDFDVVNVGTGLEYSAQEIVDTLGDLLQTEVEVVVDQSRVRAVDKMHQRADTEKLQALTGQRPQFSLEAGLRRLLHHEGLQSMPAPAASAA